MKEFWNERYAARDYVYGAEPNEFFAREIGVLPAGRLLLPGDGEGRNGVYAARLGWEVSAVDFSDVGRDKALRLAADSDVSLNYTVADLADYIPPIGSFDAVGLVFVHLEPDIRKTVHTRIADCLKPGGVVILEAFSPEQLGNTTGGPKNPAMLYTLDMMHKDFSGFAFQRAERVTRQVDEGEHHRGAAEVIQITAIKTDS